MARHSRYLRIVACGQDKAPHYPMNELTPFSAAECRLKAEAKLALADRGGWLRERLLADAEAWLQLADRLEYIEIGLAAVRRRLH
jgi:hypothetical protein